MEQDMKTLISMCGTKQSGKTTGAEFIMGYYLAQNNVIPNFSVQKDGKAYFTHGDKKFDFNIESRDVSLRNWLNDIVYKHVENIAFADCLKKTAIEQYGLSPECVYGSNDQKQEQTHIPVFSILNFLPEDIRIKYKDRTDCLTYREFLEIYGTYVCRQIDPNCHINSAITKFENSDCDIGIITDCRFSNELEAIKALSNKYRVITIKLNRKPFESDAASENGLNDVNDKDYDLVIPEDLDIIKKNDKILKYLVKHDILQKINIKVSNVS